MKVQTKYFGEVEYTKDELVTFPKGLFGFENAHSFLLLPFSDEGTLFSMQSVEQPELAFTLMHPFTLAADYAPVLHEEELKALDAQQSEELYYYVMCTVKQPAGESTINMKCPVAINPDTRMAMQVILEDDTWDMREKLSRFEAREEKSC